MLLLLIVCVQYISTVSVYGYFVVIAKFKTVACHMFAVCFCLRVRVLAF